MSAPKGASTCVEHDGKGRRAEVCLPCSQGVKELRTCDVCSQGCQHLRMARGGGLDDREKRAIGVIACCEKTMAGLIRKKRSVCEGLGWRTWWRVCKG